MDQYFTSVRELERRLYSSESWEHRPKPRVTAQPPQDIDDQHSHPGARQQDRGGTAIADAVIGRAAAGDDRHLAGEAEIVGRGLGVAHKIISLAWVRHDSCRQPAAPHRVR